jgi:beta propeller repeat protein
MVVRVSVALAVVLALGVASPASGVLTFSGGVIDELNQPGYLFHQPQLGGRYIVAERENDFTGERDVVVYNRQTEADTSIGYGDGKDQDQPAISGTRVAWIDHTEADGEVWYDDRADANPPQRITIDTRDDVGVKIDGNFVIWVDGITPGRQIKWYDIEHNEDGIVPGTNLPNGVTVDRGRVCWFDSDKRVGYEGIYVYDLETGVEIAVHEVAWVTTRIDPDSPSMHGGNVAWSQHAVGASDNKDIWVANTRSGLTSPVTSHSTTQRSPAVFGDLLAWQDDRSGNEDILAWWSPETPGFQDVARADDNETSPDVFGHSIVYRREVEPGIFRVGLSVAPLDALRVAGADRYETSAKVSAAYFPASKNVVIATGEDFPDALTASALAGALDCPLLLTRKTAVPGAVLDELDRLGTVGAWLVGGEAVIAEAVRDQLEAEGITVQRVSGPDRYATAKQVAYWVMDIVNSWPAGQWRQTAFFVRGDAFPDALAVAPHAYAQRIPILLVRPDGVPAPTEEAVTFSSITEGIIVGGTAAVNASTATTIGNLLGDAAERWDGTDRYATAARCAHEGVKRGWLDYDSIGVATGAAFPDALSGGAACGHYGSPLLLTPPTSVSPHVDTFFLDRRLDLGGMTVFGGTSAVTATTFTQLQGYLE